MRLHCDITASQSGSAGREDHVDSIASAPSAQLLGDCCALVRNDLAVGQNMPCRLQARTLGEKLRPSGATAP